MAVCILLHIWVSTNYGAANFLRGPDFWGTLTPGKNVPMQLALFRGDLQVRSSLDLNENHGKTVHSVPTLSPFVPLGG
jgi:hypothetical protein